MQDPMRINDDITVGSQPTEEQIEQLSQQGFKTIVNFRTAGEEEQPLAPDAEGEKVKAMGMEYFHHPVSTKSMGAEQVDQFREIYPTLPKPVYAHCKSGKRAGAMVMMNIACESGMSGEETVQTAEKMGFECDQPELVEFVKNYVNRNTGKQ